VPFPKGIGLTELSLLYFLPLVNYLINNYTTYILPIHLRMYNPDPSGTEGKKCLFTAVGFSVTFYSVVCGLACLAFPYT
jgi:hypothetical protein